MRKRTHKKNFWFNDEEENRIKELCNKREKIAICPIPNLEKTGFKIISHKIEIDGICANCSK